MNSIRNGTVWNLIGNVLPMLVGVVCIPFLVKHIGVESFGVLTLIWTLIGYFSIFDFGIGRALTFSVSNMKFDLDPNNLYRSINSGLKLLLITGLVGGAILALISKKLGYSWLNTNISLRNETFYAIFIASLAIPFTTYTSGIKGVLEGFEEFRVVNILKLLLGILNFTLPVFCVLLIGNSLIYIVLSLVITRVLILILYFIYLNKKVTLSAIFFRKSSTEKIDSKILHFGAWMTLSNIVSPLMVIADRFFISYVLGASVVAYYTIPFDLVIRFLILPASLTSVLFPRFSSLIQNDKDATIDLYKKSLKNVFVIMLILTILTILFSHFGLKIWINEDIANKSYKLLIILSIGVLFNSLAQIPYSLIQAAGNVKLTSLLHVSEFIIYTLLLIILVKLFGLIGASVAFVLRTIIDFLALSYISKKTLKVND